MSKIEKMRELMHNIVQSLHNWVPMYHYKLPGGRRVALSLINKKWYSPFAGEKEEDDAGRELSPRNTNNTSNPLQVRLWWNWFGPLWWMRPWLYYRMRHVTLFTTYPIKTPSTTYPIKTPDTYIHNHCGIIHITFDAANSFPAPEPSKDSIRIAFAQCNAHY